MHTWAIFFGLTPKLWRRGIRGAWMLFLLLVLVIPPASPATAQALNPNPPDEIVRLIFIHHSTGENWLSDDNGGLGLALSENNYFVSDTNYGWGPDAIGDRTDIPNWPEWFLSPESPRYLAALYTENGRNAAYTRTLPDPGGENTVVLFKSCFPNSMLEGSPTDPPDDSAGLSVGGAKGIYNNLLSYFITRPDKLFVVITAPPVADPTYAGNARAFNNWLVNDWLAENNYPYHNVAVYDFYNVLTGPDNHHRFASGGIEDVIANPSGASYYPSGDGDDHPSYEGNRKATAEFIPVLNAFYHRWKEAAPQEAAVETAETPVPAGPTEAPDAAEVEPSPGAPAPAGLVIDDFEERTPPGTNGWEVYWDESTSTKITCQPDETMAHTGRGALHAEFDIVAGSWSTCSIFYEQLQDWTAAAGIAFDLHASDPGLWYDVNIYGSPTQKTYLVGMSTPAESVIWWVHVELTWDQFRRAEWEESAGQLFLGEEGVIGIGIGIASGPDQEMAGSIWIDNLQLIAAGSGTSADSEAPEPAEASEAGVIETALPVEAPAAAPAGGTGPCSSALILPTVLACLLAFSRLTQVKFGV